MFKTFLEKELGIWPKLTKNFSWMTAGDVYTVTVEDLS
jgi:hypothetical protein